MTFFQKALFNLLLKMKMSKYSEHQPSCYMYIPGLRTVKLLYLNVLKYLYRVNRIKR